MPLYFRNKDFMFWNSRNMSIFLNRVGPFQRDYITSLTFSMECHDEEIDALEISRLAVECKSLRKLSIMAYAGFPTLENIDHVTETELFKTLSLSRNIASVEIDAEAEVATMLFVPFSERSFMHETISARRRTLVSQTVATAKPSLQPARTNFSSVIEAGTQALILTHEYDMAQNRRRPWRRGTIDYDRTRYIWVSQEGFPGTIPICNNWS